PHPEGNRRILIAKKKDYFYEIILQLKSVSSAYEIQEVQIHRVAENTTDRRWEPFLGNIRGFSCARYNIEEKSSYRAGKCLVIKAPSLPGGFFWPVGLIYQPVQDKLPPEIIATDMKNLETIFRVTTTDVVRGHYKDGKSASESTLFVEVIDTRNKPFKIVDTRNFSGGYTPPKLSSRGYASPLPLQQAVDYMRSFYKE
ncbi:MAG: hypothetical protein JXN60_07635, partial [Lentisphaerae bacterium]|nr:hypothetical protein [Lentisphaerota bacterium]